MLGLVSLACAGLAVFPGRSEAAPTTLIVFDLFGGPGLRAEAGLLRLQLMAELRRAGFEIVGRGELAAAIEAQLGPGPRFALIAPRGQQQALMKRLGASVALRGVIERSGARLRAKLSLSRVAPGGQSGQAIGAEAPDGGFGQLAHRLAQAICTALGIKPKATPLPHHPGALLPFVLAGQAQLAGRPQAAAESLAVAVASGERLVEGVGKNLAAWIANGQPAGLARITALIAAGEFVQAAAEGRPALREAKGSGEREKIAALLALALLEVGQAAKAAKALRRLGASSSPLVKLVQARLAGLKGNIKARDALLTSVLRAHHTDLGALAAVASLPKSALSGALLKLAFERSMRVKGVLAEGVRSALAAQAAQRFEELGLDLDVVLRQVRPALLGAEVRNALAPLVLKAAKAGLMSGHRLRGELALMHGQLDVAAMALELARKGEPEDLRTNLLDARLQVVRGNHALALQRYAVAVVDGTVETKSEYADELDAAGQGARAREIRLSLAGAEDVALAQQLAKDVEIDQGAPQALALAGAEGLELDKELRRLLSAFPPLARASRRSVAVAPLPVNLMARLRPFGVQTSVLQDALLRTMRGRLFQVRDGGDQAVALELSALSIFAAQQKAESVLLYSAEASWSGAVAVKLVYFDRGSGRALAHEESLEGKALGLTRLNAPFVVVFGGLLALLAIRFGYVRVRGTGAVRVAATLDPVARQPALTIALTRSTKGPKIKDPQKYTRDLKATGAVARRFTATMAASVTTFPRIPAGKYHVHVIGTYLKDASLRTLAEGRSEAIRVVRNRTCDVAFDFEPKVVELTIELFEGQTPVQGARIWLDDDAGGVALTNREGRGRIQVPRRTRVMLQIQAGDFVIKRPLQFDDTKDHQLSFNVTRERELGEAGQGYEWEGTIEGASAGYDDQVEMGESSAEIGGLSSDGLALPIDVEAAPVIAAHRERSSWDASDGRYVDAGISISAFASTSDSPKGASAPAGTLAFGAGAAPGAGGAAALAATVASASQGRGKTPPAASPLDRYENKVELGRGAMGIVYRARDRVLERDVALKVIGEELAQHPVALKMFVQEAKALAALNHPNVVTVFDQGHDCGEVFMVMELVEGTTLEKRIGEFGKLALPEGLEICDQVCAGLAYAHSKQVLHRDIKPENVMISSDGIAKIGDFGLARVLREISIQRTEVRGTPLYMSPEQIRGSDIDFRTDIYALGCTMYEIFTGRPPFIEGEVLYHHLHTEPRPPTELVHLPAALDALILSCIAKEKSDRPDSVGELREALKPLMRQFA